MSARHITCLRRFPVVMSLVCVVFALGIASLATAEAATKPTAVADYQPGPLLTKMLDGPMADAGVDEIVFAVRVPGRDHWYVTFGNYADHSKEPAQKLGFKKDGTDYHVAADLTRQANHLGVPIQADIIKQKQPETNNGFTAINFAKTSKLVYENLTTEHPIDLTRYQVAGCYMGRSGLINSGGSSGSNDLQNAVRTAVINKRAGGMGLICGRKAFQRPMPKGVELLNAIQDVYLSPDVTVA